MLWVPGPVHSPPKAPRSCHPIYEPRVHSPLGFSNETVTFSQFGGKGWSVCIFLFVVPPQSSPCSSVLPLTSLPPRATILTSHLVYPSFQWNPGRPCLERLCCSWRNAALGTTAPPWPGGWPRPPATPSRATFWSWMTATEDSTGSVTQQHPSQTFLFYSQPNSSFSLSFFFL